MTQVSKTRATVQEYYGKVLKKSQDLKTNACCSTDAMPVHARELLKKIHPEVVEKFYGCGSPIPPLLEGMTVLDLGCGSGRDSFILSSLVGASGRVIGVDMTPEQLEIARKHADFQRQEFGHARSNVEFLHGFIEDLETLGIQSASVDVVISNCVINLSPDKRRVFSEIFRVLKPGGELYFSDIFSARRIPKELAADSILLGECLGGALYTQDFRRLLAEIGCLDFRNVTQSRVVLGNREIEQKAGAIPFYSTTIRAFKLELEDRCEDYGQVAYYLGSIPQYPHAFPLDDQHLFEKGRPVPVCGNTAAMLTETRYASHFRVEGDASIHYGLFDCKKQGTPESSGDSLTPSCC